MNCFSVPEDKLYFVNEVDAMFFNTHKTNYFFSKGVISHTSKNNCTG